MIKLVKINSDNYHDVINMKLPPEQSCFVATNVYSLAEAYVYGKNTRPYAIEYNKEIVGFIMLDWDTKKRTMCIWRLMVDFDKQKKGYGRKAIEIVLEKAKRSKKIDLVYLDYVIGNDIAKKIYESFGFKPNGIICNGEVVMTLKVSDNPKVVIMEIDKDDIEELNELNDIISKLQNLPTILNNKEEVLKLIDNEQIKKIILYGDMIGIAYDKQVFIIDEYNKYYEEAKNIQ